VACPAFDAVSDAAAVAPAIKAAVVADIGPIAAPKACRLHADSTFASTREWDSLYAEGMLAAQCENERLSPHGGGLLPRSRN
jgi:hypothetical protein